jgi:SpoVK/Ycf46/Vps4 family AAA+-type ATPase
LQFLDEDTGPSIVIATTNLAEILDRAVLRRFDLVLSYELPDAGSIRQAIERRLVRFSHGRLSWSKVTSYAVGLSTADIVAAAEDAARRAVLDDRDNITTLDLINSLERRRSLQGIGRGANPTGSA